MNDLISYNSLFVRAVLKVRHFCYRFAKIQIYFIKNLETVLIFFQLPSESYFCGFLSVFKRSIAGYVTKGNR